MRTKLLVGGAVAALGVLATSGVASAQDADPVQVNLDNVWILLCAVLVIFMQAGFALVEAGLTRAKSVANIMMKNLMDFCAGAVAFFAVGYAIAFGGDLEGGGKFIGADGFFLGDGAFQYGNLTVPVTFMFQVAFAATAATIVSGAMAERTKFKAYLIYSFVISLIIYPVVVRWQWGGGWLYQLGTPFHDFAGSTIVHMTGGVCAFWGARALGPRIGKYGPDGKPRPIAAHNVPYAILGCFILLVGWFGFNPGSELAADGAIGMIAVNTCLAGAMGALTAMGTVWLTTKKPDVSMTGNGLLAGLVGITAGCAAVTPIGALIIGGAAGVLVVFAVGFFESVVKVDDPVGAIAVHGVCGAFGTLCVGLFASQDAEGFWKQGLFYGGGADQLVSQVIGVAAVLAWVSVTSIILFAVIKATVGLRVSEAEEIAGLDILEHGTAGYGEGFGSYVVPGDEPVTTGGTEPAGMA
ncbi:MAG TPA: ammonium transporter [Aquihabitans sp.]|nr:ammonium transporter [Aquihabitans sp.]